MAFTLAFTLDALPPTDGVVRVPTFVADGAAATSGAVRLPAFVADATVSAAKDLSATAPVPTTVFTAVFGSSVLARVPAAQGTFSAVQGTAGAFAVTAPPLQPAFVAASSVVGSFAATTPKATTSLNALAGDLGSFAATAPIAQSTFVASTSMYAVLSAASTAPTATFDGMRGTISAMIAHAPAPRAAFTLLRGTGAAMAATAPALRATLGGYMFIEAAMSASVPRPEAALAAELRRQLLETLCMNMLTKALSMYDGVEYNSFCELDGKYIAAGPSGLYQIEVDGTDAGAAISSLVSSGDLDFSSEFMKRVTDMYVGMRSEGNMTLRVIADEGEPNEYTLETFDVATLRQRRVLIGKGARGKYWRFELENVDGGNFELDNMNVTAVPLSRRI